MIGVNSTTTKRRAAGALHDEARPRPGMKVINPLVQIDRFCEAANNAGVLKAKIGPTSGAVLRLRDQCISGDPAELIIYWGAFYPRTDLNEERAFTAMLEHFREIVERTLGIPCEVNVLFTDTHAEINGVSEEQFDAYYIDCMRLLPTSGWTSERLSTLVGTATTPANWPTDDLSSAYSRVLELLSRQAEALPGARERASVLARQYFRQNLIESGLVSKRWPAGVFLNTGLPELSVILPGLPKLHVFSGPGNSVRKPWFISEATR